MVLDKRCARKAIADYTLSMGGVDRFDHFRSSYPINRKSRKFWMRLFLFMLDSAIINSYITYTTIHNILVHSHRDFRLRLARGLINNIPAEKQDLQYLKKKGGNFGVPDEIRLRNVGVHFPDQDTTYKEMQVL
ncbi:PiggyBac transposable element-derived protein 4 [Eumeta japonica]|uniref:PiggyBac transposable element-derived protein 4 n=1 Tax=Eumeta variegata TaxID=151549 RepID=A0A4C1W118_EUMVA|nr:PiggyBac transposable element-derived protein 4 [Eumeta japonica]